VPPGARSLSAFHSRPSMTRSSYSRGAEIFYFGVSKYGLIARRDFTREFQRPSVDKFPGQTGRDTN
jgi:hypothetical protein